MSGSHQQQHAAVLLDGAAAAQEAQHHDDHADGDHQVDAWDRLTGELRGRETEQREGSHVTRRRHGEGAANELRSFVKALTWLSFLLTFR